MNYKIYINLVSSEVYPTYCIIYKYKNYYISYEITDDYVCNPIIIDEKTLNENYLELYEYLNNSNLVCKSSSDKTYHLLYENNIISFIKSDGKYCFEYNYEIDKNILNDINTEILDYNEIFKKLSKQAGNLLKRNGRVNYLDLVNEIICKINSKESLEFYKFYSECIKTINSDNCLDMFYKIILNIDNNLNKKDLLNIVKKEIEEIKKNNYSRVVKDRKINEVLDAYNYLLKK